MILAGTGHRPPRLNLGYDIESRRLLREFVKTQVEKVQPKKIISGLAQGFDQALAEVAIELGIPLVAALPFKGQESRWPPDAQETYRRILDWSIKIYLVDDGGPANWKYIERDHWMVLNSNKLLALYDGAGSSGTASTVEFAIKQGREIVYVWDAWLAFRGN